MSEEEKQDRSNITLEAEDTALVFKEDGRLQMFLAEFDEEKEKRGLKTNEILVVSLATLLRDATFTNNVIQAFVKMRESEIQRIRKEEPIPVIPKDDLDEL